MTISEGLTREAAAEIRRRRRYDLVEAMSCVIGHGITEKEARRIVRIYSRRVRELEGARVRRAGQ